jgi:hypothetical protein
MMRLAVIALLALCLFGACVLPLEFVWMMDDETRFGSSPFSRQVFGGIPVIVLSLIVGFASAWAMRRSSRVTHGAILGVAAASLYLFVMPAAGRPVTTEWLTIAVRAPLIVAAFTLPFMLAALQNRRPTLRRTER